LIDCRLTCAQTNDRETKQTNSYAFWPGNETGLFNKWALMSRESDQCLTTHYLWDINKTMNCS